MRCAPRRTVLLALLLLAAGGARPGRAGPEVRGPERRTWHVASGPVIVTFGPPPPDPARGVSSPPRPQVRGDLVAAQESLERGEWLIGPDGAWLEVGGPPGARPSAPWPVVAADHLATERFRFAADRVLGAVASGDPAVYEADAPLWYLAAVPPGREAAIELDLPAAEPDGTARLRVAGVRTHRGPLKVLGRWGDLDLGTAVAAAGAGPFTLEYTCRASDAPAGRSRLFLADRSEVVRPEDPFDTSDDVGTLWVDRVDVSIPVGPHDGLRMPAPDGETWRVGVVDADALAPATWSAAPADVAAGAAWLAVATPPLVPGARRLAAHRAAQGLSTAVVSTAELAAPGDAEGLAAAIRRLATSGPRYVVLVGDADRDHGTAGTIPARYTRSVYNGATPTDRAYVLGDDGRARASVGRLPCADAAALDAFVTRLVKAETTPPADATRRAVRFITSEGRFSPEIDAMLENLFKEVVATHIPAAYDVSVTFARPQSEFGWPAAAFNEKVLDDLNAGALFYTYVGHGWWNGFDDLRVDGRRFPILKVAHADRVAVRGTPPAMFVIACTTALFDDPDVRSIGERLLDRPAGPLAYFGATRVCHPAWNSLLGRELAREMFQPGERRLGDVIEAAVVAGLGPVPPQDTMRRVIEMGAAVMLRKGLVDLPRLKVEGAAMYVLLGDPATRLPMPRADLGVVATRADGEGAVDVEATGPFPDGTEVRLTLEVPRTTPLPFARDAAWSPEETMQRRHDRANDKTLAEAVVAAKDGRARARLTVPAAHARSRLLPTAWAIFGGDAHLGGGVLEKAP